MSHGVPVPQCVSKAISERYSFKIFAQNKYECQQPKAPYLTSFKARQCTVWIGLLLKLAYINIITAFCVNIIVLYLSIKHFFPIPHLEDLSHRQCLLICTTLG